VDSLPQRLGDTNEDSVGLAQDVVVPEPEHAVSPLAQEFRPLAVRTTLRGVLPAVEFDHQASIGTAEINDERPDRVLSAELRTKEVSVA
jgi:hypothetical protein